MDNKSREQSFNNLSLWNQTKSADSRSNSWRRQSRPLSLLNSHVLLLLTGLTFVLHNLSLAGAQTTGFSTLVDTTNSSFPQPVPVNLTALAAGAPICSTVCYPWDTTYFANHRNPCQDHFGDEKWLSCLCTDRPFVRYIVDCVFRKCGPAIPTALDFGYNICLSQNILLPSPPDLLRILNITVVPIYAFETPETLPNYTTPFATSFPPPVYGASDSDDNPALTRNLTLSASGAGRIRSFAEFDDLRWLFIAGIAWWVWVVGLLGL